MRISIFFTLFPCQFVFAAAAAACPLIGGLVDFNCDGAHRIVVVGDSIVKGTGDLRFKNNGGYVTRLQKKFKKSEVVNMGKPGYGTGRLYSFYKKALSKKKSSRVKTALSDADLIIIDAGRNDFFLEAQPGLTVRNLERLAQLFRDELGKGKNSTEPYIILASLLPTRRGFQRAFINSTNAILQQRAGTFPKVELPFVKVNLELISLDGIHPTSKGYDAMAKIAAKVIKTQTTREMLALRPDRDKDGIYDMFEIPLFGTDPNLKDTDGDSIPDGEEVFVLGTDPLTPDL